MLYYYFDGYICLKDAYKLLIKINMTYPDGHYVM